MHITAPAAHSTASNRIPPNPPSSARPLHTDDNTAGHAPTEQSSEQPDELLGSDDHTSGVTEQDHENHQEDEAPNREQPNTRGLNDTHETIEQVKTEITDENNEYQTEADAVHMDITEPAENQAYDDSYGHYEQNIEENYEQNYQQNPETDAVYSQEYEKEQIPHEENQQSGYEQQYENYEQYPQQYADPNAQYDGQFENYTTDGHYQGDYNDPQYHEYPADYQEPSVTKEPVAANPEVTEDVQGTTELPPGVPANTKSEINPNRTDSNGS